MDSANFLAAPEVASASRWIGPVLFAVRALVRPRRIGAVLPSGFPLAEAMARMAPGHAIVELGPGTGSITRRLLARLPESGQILALELDSGMAFSLQDRLMDPRLTVHAGDASDLADWIGTMGWDRVDAVVSGLPFQAFPAPARDCILAAARNALTPTGRFVAFQYGLRLLPAFRQHFRRVHVVGPIWRNLPPAYVIVGRV